jgi:hypothetical protein
LRYINAFEEKTGTHFRVGEVFIDLNWPRTNWWNPDYFPAVVRLCTAIRNNAFDTAIVDLAPEDPRNWGPYNTIIPLLTQAGARVYNAYFDDENALAEKLNRRYRRAARDVVFGSVPSDCSDFIAFFPALASNVALEALRGDDDPSGLPSDIRRRLEFLAKENPYAAGQYPFIEGGLHRRILDRLKQLELEDGKQRRDAGERLFRLGPNHDGALLDEGFYGSDTVRTPEDLERAERRLVEELRFSRYVNGQIISYVRELDEYLVFGDPRRKGFLGFRVYKKDRVLPERPKRHKKPDASVSPSTWEDFRLPDNWKNDLENKFIHVAYKRIEQLQSRH